MATFYAFLVPFGMFIAAAACTVVFLMDHYLLLRRWAQLPMMDAAMAVRVRISFLLGFIVVKYSLVLTFQQLRQQALFAVAAHMYVTSLYIYGWPFDEAVPIVDQATGTTVSYRAVDKLPYYSLLRLSPQTWQDSAQLDLFGPYKVSDCILCIIMHFDLETVSSSHSMRQ